MKRIIKVKTDISRYIDDICKYHPWLSRLGAYIDIKEYDILTNNHQYGVYKYMPIKTKVPVQSKIYLKYNELERNYWIMQCITA